MKTQSIITYNTFLLVGETWNPQCLASQSGLRMKLPGNMLKLLNEDVLKRTKTFSQRPMPFKVVLYKREQPGDTGSACRLRIINWSRSHHESELSCWVLLIPSVKQ